MNSEELSLGSSLFSLWRHSSAVLGNVPQKGMLTLDTACREGMGKGKTY